MFWSVESRAIGGKELLWWTPREVVSQWWRRAGGAWRGAAVLVAVKGQSSPDRFHLTKQGKRDGAPQHKESFPSDAQRAKKTEYRARPNTRRILYRAPREDRNPRNWKVSSFHYFIRRLSKSTNPSRLSSTATTTTTTILLGFILQHTISPL